MAGLTTEEGDFQRMQVQLEICKNWSSFDEITENGIEALMKLFKAEVFAKLNKEGSDTVTEDNWRSAAVADMYERGVDYPEPFMLDFPGENKGFLVNAPYRGSLSFGIHLPELSFMTCGFEGDQLCFKRGKQPAGLNYFCDVHKVPGNYVASGDEQTEQTRRGQKIRNFVSWTCCLPKSDNERVNILDPSVWLAYLHALWKMEGKSHIQKIDQDESRMYFDKEKNLLCHKMASDEDKDSSYRKVICFHPHCFLEIEEDVLERQILPGDRRETRYCGLHLNDLKNISPVITMEEVKAGVFSDN